MTTIDGQLWQRCVECETLVPAPARNYAGLCFNCAPVPEPEPVDRDQVDTKELPAE